jgi:hypothetical protein
VMTTSPKKCVAWLLRLRRRDCNAVFYTGFAQILLLGRGKKVIMLAEQHQYAPSGKRDRWSW